MTPSLPAFASQARAHLPFKRWPLMAGCAFALLLGASSLTTVPAGHRGVLTTFGRVHERPLTEGLHVRIPIAQRVVPMNVQIQKGEGGDTAASRDLQRVDVKVAINYRIDPPRAAEIYQRVGTLPEVGDRIILPAVHEAVKASVAQFTAEDLVTQRTAVRQRIREQLEPRLAEHGILVEDFAIVGFAFGQEFAAAIEAKSKAEQERMKAERDLERIRVESEQHLARARAESQALRMQREQITPELLQWEALKRWDGGLPEVVAGQTGTALTLQLPLSVARSAPTAPARP